MKKLTVLCAGLAFVLSAVGAARAADLAGGKKLYEAKCAMCHGKDAKGNPAMAKMFKLPIEAMSLVSEAAAAKPEADFIKITEAGKDKMPSFKGKLKDAEIADVLAYSRSLAGGKKAAAPEPSAAKKAYETKCASCHGKDGKGNAALVKALKVEPASLDLTAPATAGKTDAELLAVMQKGAGKMPAYAGKLSDKEIEDLVGYSRSLAPKEAPKAEAK